MPSEPGPAKAEEILEFWFGREGEPGYGEFREAWFRKDPEFDRRVRDRFEDLYEAAARGELEGWREGARSCLALVILLDQFPRNMFRGDPRSYATGSEAQETAEYAVDRALDRELPAFQRMFLYREIGQRTVVFKRLVNGCCAQYPDAVEDKGCTKLLNTGFIPTASNMDNSFLAWRRAAGSTTRCSR